MSRALLVLLLVAELFKVSALAQEQSTRCGFTGDVCTLQPLPPHRMLLLSFGTVRLSERVWQSGVGMEFVGARGIGIAGLVTTVPASRAGLELNSSFHWRDATRSLRPFLAVGSAVGLKSHTAVDLGSSATFSGGADWWSLKHVGVRLETIGVFDRRAGVGHSAQVRIAIVTR
jgi:hypothetical protein